MSQLLVKKIEKDNSIKVLFTGAVHGNEQCGTKAINRVIDMFESNEIFLEKGSVTFMPICNPRAYEENTRDVGTNLNRVIDIYENPNSYEEIIASQVADEILKADYMIDLHSSYTDDAPFSFLDYDTSENRKLVEASCAKYFVSGFPEVYKDSDICEMSTETFANLKGNTNCITLECGNHYARESEEFAFNTIINLLKSLGMIDGKFNSSVEVEQIHIEEMVLKRENGTLAKEFQNFDLLSKGDLIATYENGEKIYAEEDSVMVLPNVDAKIGHEWFYIAKKR
ncbi:MAG: succinylglutamate desuccinylase/aspartoacylase family protein [Alphaproteobacteria bacterium]|nr:succinylglutamate desuccinylase/aspartoacylase family protein [Alphaproteobacteria bacterium]